MSDAAASAPSAPAAAPSAPAAPAQGALPLGGTPAPAAPHHASLQPRTPAGQFSGPPDPAKAPPATPPTTPEPPKAWKVGQREFKTPEELALYAEEADAERGALTTWRQRAIEAEAKRKEMEERLKDPSKLVTDEMRQRYVMDEVRKFQEAEALKQMDEPTRRLYLLAKENERKAAEMEAKVREYETQQAEAKRKAEEEAAQKAEQAAIEEMRATLTQAVQLAGLDPQNPWDFQRVAFVVRGAAERGVVYTPEVIARKVKEGIANEQRMRLKAAQPAQLLNDVPELVAALNGIEDASLLRQLAPLGEKLRRLNLQVLGAAPTPAPTPVATRAGAPVDEVDTSKLAPGDPRWQEVLERRLK